MIKRHLKSNVHEVKSLSPRVLRITLKTKRTTFNLCFCYGPHNRRDVKEYKDFLEILSKHITIKPCCQNIICGDLNAKLKAKAKPVTGNYELHNKQDNRLYYWTQKETMGKGQRNQCKTCHMASKQRIYG